MTGRNYLKTTLLLAGAMTVASVAALEAQPLRELIEVGVEVGLLAAVEPAVVLVAALLLLDPCELPLELPGFTARQLALLEAAVDSLETIILPEMPATVTPFSFNKTFSSDSLTNRRSHWPF